MKNEKYEFFLIIMYMYMYMYIYICMFMRICMSLVRLVISVKVKRVRNAGYQIARQRCITLKNIIYVLCLLNTRYRRSGDQQR